MNKAGCTIHYQDVKTGEGMVDIQKLLSRLPGLPWSKYPGEKHIPQYQACGPGTRFDICLDENDIPKPGDKPINRVDQNCY